MWRTIERTATGFTERELYSRDGLARFVPLGSGGIVRPLALWVASLTLLSTLSSCGNSQASRASPRTASADEAFVQAFIGNCVQTFPDVSKIDAAAVALDWKRVTDSAMLKTLGPSSGDSDWKAFAFKYDGQPLLLAVSTSSKTDQVRFCTLIGEPKNIDATRGRLVKLLKAEAEESSEESGQRYHIYTFDNDERATVLSFIDAAPMGMKMLNASTMIVPPSQL